MGYMPNRCIHRATCCRCLVVDLSSRSCLSVARLDAAKRIDMLLYALVHEPRLRAVMVGRGPEGERLKRLAAELRIADRVQFTGFLPDQEVADLYRRCRAVYYAPVDEDYGFITIEALASGKPVLTTTDAGGVLEFIEDQVNGFVSPPSPEALATRLTALSRRSDSATAGCERSPACRRDPLGSRRPTTHRAVASAGRRFPHVAAVAYFQPRFIRVFREDIL